MFLARKPSKLQGEIIKQNYKLEYGVNSLSIQKNALKKYSKYAIVDDLLATGGTLKCAEDLISEVGGNVVLTIVAIELNALKGREKIQSDVFSVLSYD